MYACMYIYIYIKYILCVYNCVHVSACVCVCATYVIWYGAHGM